MRKKRKSILYFFMIGLIAIMLSGCQKKKITYHPTSYLMTKESGKNYPALKTQKKFEDAFAMTKLSAKKDTTLEKTDRKSDETLKEENAPAVQETDMADRINNQTSDEKRVSQKEQKSKRNSSTSSKKDSADTKTKKAATEKKPETNRTADQTAQPSTATQTPTEEPKPTQTSTPKPTATPKPKKLAEIQVDGELRNDYNKGETVDLSVLTVKAVYEDGSTKTLSRGEYEMDGLSTSSLGKHICTITYQGKSKELSYRVYQYMVATYVVSDEDTDDAVWHEISGFTLTKQQIASLFGNGVTADDKITLTTGSTVGDSYTFEHGKGLIYNTTNQIQLYIGFRYNKKS